MEIDPSHARVHVSHSVQLTATVKTSDIGAVTWQLGGDGCSGMTCGTISSTGLYSGPRGLAGFSLEELMVHLAIRPAPGFDRSRVWVDPEPDIGAFEQRPKRNSCP